MQLVKVDENLPIYSPDYTVAELEQHIQTAVTAATVVLPMFNPDFEDWMSEEYNEIVGRYSEVKGGNRKRKMGRKIRKMREQLKNNLYENRARRINQAAEMKLIEEEYRIAKNMKIVD